MQYRMLWPCSGREGKIVIELYLSYIKLIIQHIVILSGAQRNLPIYFLYICSPYTSNINVQNYHMINFCEV